MSTRPTEATAVVVTGPRQIELRQMPIPVIGDDEGLLELEVNGICGSDSEFYEGTLGPDEGYPSPMTLGHEPVGRVLELGESARKRWGVDVGDRVVVNSAIRCGDCAECRAGRDCRSASYGTMSPDQGPGLWGGLGTHLFLPPGATLIPMRDDIPLAEVAFHNPLANGFEWTDVAGQVGPESRVTIFGAGPRGLSCAMVAVYLGAEQVTLVGLEQDRTRLDLAESMGVHAGVVLGSSEASALRDQVGPQTVVIDTSPHSVVPVEQGLAALERGGRLVMAGIKGGRKTVALDVDDISNGRKTIVGPYSKSLVSLRRAVEAVESGTMHLDLIPSQAFSLAQTEEAIVSLSSKDPDRPLHVRVEPGLA